VLVKARYVAPAITALRKRRRVTLVPIVQLYTDQDLAPAIVYLAAQEVRQIISETTTTAVVSQAPCRAFDWLGGQLPGSASIVAARQLPHGRGRTQNRRMSDNILHARSFVNMARNRQSSPTSTTGSPYPTMAVKRTFGALSVRTVEREVRAAHGLGFRERSLSSH
jgi:hypothetical protein